MNSLESRLATELHSYERVVVAFSGGVDSATLASSALRALGRDRMLAVTADSDSLATGELEHCADLARQWDMPWQSVATNELSNTNYVANSGDRCYWCKDALMDALEPIAAAIDATITLGVNIDDLGDHRPGQEAARKRGARFPLVDAGLHKSDIRELAKRWGLPVWDRPAMPCLSSRVPYGTPVTINVLTRIDRAELELRRIGFNDLRVRHYGDTARIEVPSHEMAKVVANSEDIVTSMQRIGYLYVTLDLAGLRSGNLNAALSNERA
ncbi:MAG: ATP-dependent sacrificial sulfur transferase LarE [Actinomycetia bacterium]|nr:ATP-dependent sacrificial sulfur transferase LarE [Actinomycetes bacterium]